MSEWTKLDPVKGSVACLTCGCGARSDLDMERSLMVGFGDAGWRRDGATTSTEPRHDDGDGGVPTVADIEKMAVADPDHDWRIYFFAPLYEAEYQRQGDGVWVLVKSGLGFA